jgi:AraC family transcriptional regulator
MTFSQASFRSDDPSTTHSAVARLLEDAGSALAEDRPLARSLIEKAWALLRAEEEAFSSGSLPIRRGGLAPWQAHRVANHIDVHLAGKIPIRDLASIVRLSSGYFARAFRRTFEEAPHHYIVRHRLELAKKTMLMSNSGLSEIAFACGFSDQAHMTKLFHHRVGESPGIWRRNHRGRAELNARCASRQADGENEGAP